MNKFTKITVSIALNAICATLAFGLISVAMAAGVPCNQEVDATCLNTCGGYAEGQAFVCCSTYGTACCRRMCNVVYCVADPGEPCNTQAQTAASAGTTDPVGICTDKGTCIP